MGNEECKQKIIQLVNNINDSWILYHILKFVQGMTKERE